jgi:hypothetical protein
MLPVCLDAQAPVASPAYHRAQQRLGPTVHLDALTLVTRLHLLALCRLIGALRPLALSADELGKRTAIERFFGRVFSYFRLGRGCRLSVSVRCYYKTDTGAC